MAPTWPSIIPLGATTCAPALAWATAMRVHLQGGVVVDRSPPAVEDAAMTVIGVLVDAQICHDDHPVAHLAAQVARRDLHNSLRIEGLRCRWNPWWTDPEENDGADAEVGQLLDLLSRGSRGVLHDAGQRDDRLRFVDAFANEQRCDELGNVEVGLGDEVPQRCRCSQTSGA